MANKERIARLLSILSEWTPELHISQVDNALYSLYEEGLTQKEENELKEILSTNEHFEDEELKKFVAVPSLSKDAWWLDPSNW